MPLPYVADAFSPQRRPTREVRVGDVGVGGENPIRVQSMTTTDTLDTEGTVAQVERMVAAGCEIVRVTAPSLNEARNLEAIARTLKQRGVHCPLVADIHYTPNAALLAAEYVEKIRVNPGNFADKKKFAVREYTDAQYAEEVERAAERFRPLIRRCAELGRAIRIGTNHGSLSDRIMNRFGDSPRGMVESALEFLDVCEDEGYREIVFSMKSSNPQVAIQAYRLLAAQLAERDPGNPSYPFHLGVTEAGDGEDGRIKSAIGIGALLEDGIGDTIRVSLTEDPVREVPVAEALARTYEARWGSAQAADPGATFAEDPYAYRRRSTRSSGLSGFEIGGSAPVRVELELGDLPLDPEQFASQLAATLAETELACEGLVVDVFDPVDYPRVLPFGEALANAGLRLPLAIRCDSAAAEPFPPPVSRQIYPVGALVSDESLRDAAASMVKSGGLLEWELRGRLSEIPELLDRALAAGAAAGVEEFMVGADAVHAVHGARLLSASLRARGAADVPIALRHYVDPRSGEASLCQAAADLGAPLCDGIGDVVSLSGVSDARRALELAYRILQGARLRTSWTEFISCPSCGRTLFDLEETTARIRERTQHLPGVKIAIMGCIVNGPGEMADADFGYVGSGPGIVNLYVGKEIIERSVPENVADDRLVELIRQEGRWVDPD